MHLATYLGLQHGASQALAASFRQVADGHAAEPDVHVLCHHLAQWCDGHVERLRTAVERYGEQREEEPERLHAQALSETRSGGVGLLRDLQDLYLLASLVDITWTVLGQAAQGVRDRELLQLVAECEQETTQQLRWLNTRIKQAAPQALLAGGGST
ncbi:hypothetical protein [Vallicoccus soli]|uniref:Molybdopterin oxidoreductase n=1 Tax=Vallicoccus soli TaxID=2339232 RepID=A0A3A3Z6N7_9ACTN|nr:hypothetical protein [Vallicoccus soli]RJK97587.1 hypothetical protein D5H78_00685 [Vallicoccus soli]